MIAEDRKARERYLERIALIKAGANINPFETKEEQRARIERAKKDVGYFVTEYLPHFATSPSADFHTELARMVRRNKTGKVLVRWGRGLAKSVWCDTILPLWLWINDDIHYMVIVGNNYDKAEILLTDLQAEFTNPKLCRDFGEQLNQGSWTDGYFATKNGFTAKAIGMGQDARGLRNKSQRPDYIVCDDLEDKDTLKNPKRQDEVVRWIERSLLPTMDGPVRRYLHPNNDFAPRTIQNQLEARHPNWKVHRVDACPGAERKPRWREKYPDNYYLEIEEEIGTLALEAEYNNIPHVEGSVFTEDMIAWDTPPRIDTFGMIVGYWDVAYSGRNDYNAVKVMGLKDTTFWHLKAFCKQCLMKDAVRFMYDYENQLPPSVIVHWRVERQFWNQPVQDVIQEVEAEQGRPLNIIVVDRPTARKYDRILTMHPYYQNGRYRYNANEKGNNDMQTGIAQLLGIEPGYRSHDDMPDADQQATEELGRYARIERFNPRVVSRGTVLQRSKNRF